MRRNLLTAAFVLTAAACGGESESAPTPPSTASEPMTSTEPTSTAPTTEPTAPPSKPKPLPGLPRYTAGYDTWIKLTKKPIPPRASGDAHLGAKKVYASKHAGANGRFPDGTIIVKEAVRPGKDFLGLIAVMRKEQGADPAHNDWRFVEFTRDGRRDRFSKTASGAICWTCHMGAAKTDYVWIFTLGLGK
jgi:Cytochrome P460